MSSTPGQPRAAVKLVKETDFNKHAYLPNSEQQEILRLAGIKPLEGGNPRAPGFKGVWVSSGDREPIEFSYYRSIREGSGREPESRIGRSVTDRIEVGRYLHMAWDGTSVLFYMKDQA